MTADLENLNERMVKAETRCEATQALFASALAANSAEMAKLGTKVEALQKTLNDWIIKIIIILSLLSGGGLAVSRLLPDAGASEATVEVNSEKQ